MPMQLIQQAVAALYGNDLVAMQKLIDEHDIVRSGLSECVPVLNAPVLAAARSRAMVDLLLRNGAKLTKTAEWWSAGIDPGRVLPDIAEYLIECGADCTVHSLAATGLAQRLAEMLAREPELVHAGGMDGARPLHFAANVEIARLLLLHGAEVDARDADHDSTAAQWRIGDVPEVSRYLLQHGATEDIFMAAAFGARDMATRLVAHQPACCTWRIGNNSGPFPGIGFQGRGGTIYQWTLGFNLTPQEVALKFGHCALYDYLMEHTPPKHRLLVACTRADRPLAEAILAGHPAIMQELNTEDHGLLAKMCWETNKNIAAVRLMLDVGFPPGVPEHNHGYSPLHNAAWCGDPDLVELLLQHKHPVDGKDPNYHATALGFALHSALVAKRHPEGDFPRVCELLLAAGCPCEPTAYPSGNEAIDVVLRQHCLN